VHLDCCHFFINAPITLALSTVWPFFCHQLLLAGPDGGKY
jgi:hypothetical protein